MALRHVFQDLKFFRENPKAQEHKSQWFKLQMRLTILKIGQWLIALPLLPFQITFFLLHNISAIMMNVLDWLYTFLLKLTTIEKYRNQFARERDDLRKVIESKID